jgi:hypothetical protein
MVGSVLVVAGEVVTWPLNIELLKAQHEIADELVPALKTKELVLPVGLVKEHHIESDGEVLDDFAEFGEDFVAIFPLLALHEIHQPLAKGVNLLNGGAVFDNNWHRFGEGSTATLVKNEESVEIAIGSLDDVAFHLLELGVQESDLLDVVIISSQVFACVAVDRNTVADVKGMSAKLMLAGSTKLNQSEGLTYFTKTKMMLASSS